VKKRFVRAITIGLAISNLTPIVANADVDVNKEVPNETTETDKKNEVNETNKMDKEQIHTQEEKLEVSNIDSNFFKRFPKINELPYEKMGKVTFLENTSGTYENPIKTDINKELDKAIIKLNKAIKNKDVRLLKETIKDTFYLHEILDYDNTMLHKENDQFDYLILNSIALTFQLGEKDEKLKNELLTFIADEMYISSANKFNAVGAGNTTFLNRYGSYLVKLSEHYIKDEKTSRILLYAYSDINAMYYLTNGKSMTKQGEANTVYNPELVPSKVDFSSIPKIPEAKTEKDNDEIIDLLDPIIPPIEKPNGDGKYVKVPDFDYSFTDSEYIIENGVCYKVKRYRDKDGTVVRTEREKITEACVIKDNVNDAEKITLEEHNAQNQVDLRLEVWNSLQVNDLNDLNDNTIQFTINKNSAKPYYYDTRIKASSNDTITFNQLKDALQQMKSKTKIYLLEDKSRLLLVAEGKTLLVIEKKEEFTSDEIYNLLNKFEKIGLKIDEKKSLEETSLDEIVSNVESITFKGKEVTLNKKPILKDNILQLPIEEVAKIMGYDVEDLKDKLVLTFNENNNNVKIEIIKKTNKIIINGINKMTTTETQISENVLFGEMSLIAKELGYNINFDSEIGLINID